MKWKLFTGWRYCLFFCLLLSVISACTLPSGGYYSRMENKAENMLNIARKNEANTYATAKNTSTTAKNTGDETSKKETAKITRELETSRESIPAPEKVPEDKNSGDWTDILFYILFTYLGVEKVAKGAHFLYKAKPGEI